MPRVYIVTLFCDGVEISSIEVNSLGRVAQLVHYFERIAGFEVKFDIVEMVVQ